MENRTRRMLWFRWVVACAFLFLAASCARGGRPGTDGGGSRDAGRDASRLDANPEVCVPPCVGTQVCRGGRCIVPCDPEGMCPDSQRCCGGACVDTSRDPLHCSSCDQSCFPAGNICADSECTCGSGPPCVGGETCCGGRCADLTSSPADCGACGVPCADGMACEDSACVTASCTPACRDEEVCSDGVCRCGAGAGCPEGRGCCAGACINTATDSMNCGRCGMRCAATETCIGGTCTTDVPCMPACAIGEACAGGVCRCGTGAACTAGQGCCGVDGCRDTARDVLHCGRCGNACPAGFQCCDGACRDTNTDRSNCGRCGESCDELADGCTAGNCTCGGGPQCLLTPCFLGMCFII
jgi:hypothetical protein